jgi:hypothetical protein
VLAYLSLCKVHTPFPTTAVPWLRVSGSRQRCWCLPVVSVFKRRSPQLLVACVSNRDTDPPIQKLLHAVDMICIDYHEAHLRRNRANNKWNSCHSRIGRSRQQAQKKICLDFVHALLELAIWLQAGEDRAIAAGSQSDLKTGCRRLQLTQCCFGAARGPRPYPMASGS